MDRSTEYSIRRATAADAAEIQIIMHAAFSGYLEDIGNTYKLHALTESIDDINDDIKKNAVFVAVTPDGSVIGSIRVKKLTDDLAYIYRFGVHPSMKNAGVGSRLLAAAIDYCVGCGFKAVALHTNTKFFTLVRYYYGKRFFVHSTSTDKGYIRALFVKELTPDHNYDITPAFGE